jgi:putative peptidoglycan lipid II flippase
MSFIRSVTTVGSYTLLSRVSGFVRDVLTATYLGAGATADAFFIAFQFPNLFRSLFAEGAFSAGFVPIFTQTLARDGKTKAKEFADDAFAVLATALLVFSVIMIIAMPVVLFVMAPGFADIPGQMEKTTELARIAFPYLFFISLTALQSGVLNAFDRFAAPAFAPVLLNITLIAALLAGAGTKGDPAFFLAWGVFLAGVVQFFWLAAACRSIDMRFQLRRPRLTPEVKLLLTRMLPVMFGAGIYQLNLVVNKIVATLVSPGAVSWLYYADRVNLLPVGIIGFSIGVALVPLLSRHIQNGDTAAALHDQNRAIELSILLTVPAAVGIALLAEPITSVLFERGAFMPADREAVAAALLAFSFGLPAYVLNKALTPGFFSRGDTKTPVRAALAAFIVCLVLNLALMNVLGHVGIALATSVSAWVNIAMLVVILRRRGFLVEDRRLLLGIAKITLAAVVMGAALWGGTQFLATTFGPLFGSPNGPSGAMLPRSAALGALIVIGAAIYGGVILITGAAKLSDLRGLRRRSTPTA